MEAADVAAFVAAGASIGALGTSIYGVRHTTKAAARLERVRWTRERLIDSTRSLLNTCRMLVAVMFSENVLKYPVERGESELSMAPQILHEAPQKLSEATMDLIMTAQLCLWKLTEAGAGQEPTPKLTREHAVELDRCRKDLMTAIEKYEIAVRDEFGLND